MTETFNQDLCLRPQVAVCITYDLRYFSEKMVVGQKSFINIKGQGPGLGPTRLPRVSRCTVGPTPVQNDSELAHKVWHRGGSDSAPRHAGGVE